MPEISCKQQARISSLRIGIRRGGSATGLDALRRALAGTVHEAHSASSTFGFDPMCLRCVHPCRSTYDFPANSPPSIVDARWQPDLPLTAGLLRHSDPTRMIFRVGLEGFRLAGAGSELHVHTLAIAGYRMSVNGIPVSWHELNSDHFAVNLGLARSRAIGDKHGVRRDA